MPTETIAARFSEIKVSPEVPYSRAFREATRGGHSNRENPLRVQK